MNDAATLLRDTPVLFEGAMGTCLIARGLPLGAPGELFTLRHPDRVAEVHRAYVAAGARVLKTNTFNANRPRLTAVGLADDLALLNRRGVELAREAADDRCVVAGVIGPTGLILAPTGTAREAELAPAFAEQAEVLVAAGVDYLLVETMFDLREALAALTACREVTDLPVINTMTFTRTPRGFLSLAGDGAGDALAELASAGAFAVGTNCTLNSAAAASLAPVMRKHLPDAVLLIAPCAGQPQTFLDELRYPDTPETFAEHMLAVVDAGVDMVGGCCGTTPDHARHLARALAARRTPH